MVFNFPLYYYSIYQPGSFVLPKGQNWTTSYETNYNEINEIKQIKIVLSKYSLDKSRDGHYYVNNKDYYDNERKITQYLEAHGYGEIIPGLTLEGELTPNIISALNVSYNKKLNLRNWLHVEIE